MVIRIFDSLRTPLLGHHHGLFLFAAPQILIQINTQTPFHFIVWSGTEIGSSVDNLLDLQIHPPAGRFKNLECGRGKAMKLRICFHIYSVFLYPIWFIAEFHFSCGVNAFVVARRLLIVVHFRKIR